MAVHRNALLAGIVLAGLVAVGATAWQAYSLGRRSIEAATFERLTSLRESKRREIIRYLEESRDQAALLARSPGAVRAIGAFRAAFRAIAPGDDDGRAVHEFYRDQYAPRAAEAGAVVDTGALVPRDPLALAAQAIFLARNPYPPGEKHEVADPGDGSGYARAHVVHHTVFRRVIETFGFYDLFLIDPKGRIVYSVFKEIDFATSLVDGPHRDSNLAAVFRLALIATEEDSPPLVDFRRYAPSYMAPAAFIAAPIRDAGQLLGVLAVQLPVDRMNSVMTGDGDWKEDGLGESGETYLVGTDFLMRSDSRFVIEEPERFLGRLRSEPGARNVEQIDAYKTTILFQEVRTEASMAALAGETGTGILADYRGLSVLSSYAPLSVPGIEWAILSEIDAEEVFAPIVTLRNRVVGLSVLIAAIFIGLGAGLSAMIARNERISLVRDRMEHDLSIARAIQQGLLPSGKPSLHGYDIAGWSQPAEETGGDYFDWQRLPSGRFAVTLADVTGHGIGPALVTAVCRAYVRASLSDHQKLDSVMTRINRLLYDDLPPERLITLVVGLLDVEKHSVEVLSAGHGPLCFYRSATGEVETHNAHDIPFGVFDDRNYGPSDHIEFEPGDVLILLTDGFFEWENPTGEDFGIERLRESISRAAALDAQQIIEAIHRDVLTHATDTPQVDDLTAIVIKRVAEDGAATKN